MQLLPTPVRGHPNNHQRPEQKHPNDGDPTGPNDALPLLPKLLLANPHLGAPLQRNIHPVPHRPPHHLLRLQPDPIGYLNQNICGPGRRQFKLLRHAQTHNLHQHDND